MPIPLIVVGAAGATALGAYLHSWFTGEEDAWKDSDVFNARMRDLHQTALVLNDALAKCPAFMKDTNQLMSWRAARDGFSKFYKDVGTVYLDPSEGVVIQAKDYANRFYQWAQQYDRYKCGSSFQPVIPTPDPHKPDPPPWDPMDSPYTPWVVGAGALVLVGFLLGRPPPRGRYRNPRRCRGKGPEGRRVLVCKGTRDR